MPILQKQFPEIVDFYLPPEGCSYRMAIVSMKKQYPGHAKRVMMGVWLFLRQFMYTKFIIVVDVMSHGIIFPQGATHSSKRGLSLKASYPPMVTRQSVHETAFRSTDNPEITL